MVGLVVFGIGRNTLVHRQNGIPHVCVCYVCCVCVYYIIRETMATVDVVALSNATRARVQITKADLIGMVLNLMGSMFCHACAILFIIN